MHIFIHTEPNPEDNAMLQALYSRSPKSVTEHLEKLRHVGSGKFMEQFYLGYGHASIADCGFVTIYFEGISMLAAKALEDNPLFNGQECSSRYIDFSNQPFVNPFPAGSEASNLAQKALDACRSFYVTNLEPVRAHLRQRFPNEVVTQDFASDSAYEKAINAKAFDILRGYLPAGATTNVAWTTSLRKAHERLTLLMHHPLAEIRKMSAEAYVALYFHFPHSFKSDYAAAANALDLGLALKDIEGDALCNHLSHPLNFYSTEPSPVCNPLTVADDTALTFEVIDLSHVLGYNPTAANHPAKQLPHRHAAVCQDVFRIGLTLDFGSFRDLQRHRGGYCSNPVLDASGGFHPWYYDQLPAESKASADQLFSELSRIEKSIVETDGASWGPSPWERVDAVKATKMLCQYFVPMGVLVPVTLVYSLHQAIYVAELRSGKTVHPTLRVPSQKLASYFKGSGFQVHADMEESDWTLRRGRQDILPK